MLVRRVALLIAVVVMGSACAGGGVLVPTPTPTPPSGTTGTVTGTVAVAASRVPQAAGVPARPLRRTLSRPGLVPDQLMVKFRPGVGAGTEAEVNRQAGAVVLRTIERLGVQVVRLSPGAAAGAAMAAYRGSGQVEYVEQDKYVYATATPNDTMYLQQWHYPQINLPTAWDLTTGGAVIVAVLDTGTRPAHPDLVGVHVTGYDFVTSTANGDGDGRDADPTDPGCPSDPDYPGSHGTHVEGTVAARTNNNLGVAGVNWGGASPAKIMTLRVLGGCGSGTYSDLADAILYAADHGAKVINMSLGGEFGSTTVDNAITYARNAGVTSVAAAGNDSSAAVCNSILYPARNPNVIAVAATTSTNQRAYYSNCGPEMDVAAPGGGSASDPPAIGPGVLSTTWSPNVGNTYLSFQGTSMATPHVAGLAALMISRGILGPAAIQNTLQSTATDLGDPGFDNAFGWGLVNAAAAVGGGTAAGRLRAFSGVISGPVITVQSDVVVVLPNGTFTITSAQPGTKSVFIWQDFNANGIVDTGDSYGQVNGVVITAGNNTPIGAVTVSRYTGPALTVTGGP